jgi:hypothetical protein
MVLIQAIKCGADKRQTAVEITAKPENNMRHKRSMTIAANFHSLMISCNSSSLLILLVINFNSLTIGFKSLQQFDIWGQLSVGESLNRALYAIISESSMLL